MNQNWKNFLLSQQADLPNSTDVVFPGSAFAAGTNLYALAHLAVLTVGGNDAATLLQGQITCNVNELSDTQSRIAALCTPKGRVLATFILVKDEAVFRLLMPVELLATVKKRLAMYVLRSAVTITDSTDEFALLGVQSQTEQLAPWFTTCRHAAGMSVKVSAEQGLYVHICPVEQASAVWSDYLEQGFTPHSSTAWRYWEIISGLPWLTEATAEAFIPQMLNLDELGGISYTKGCYTGQEIVARTHYLGSSKRAMFVADCACAVPPPPDMAIVALAGGTQTVVGKVLQAALGADGRCKLLLVVQLAEAAVGSLHLHDTLEALTLITEPQQ